MTSDKSLMTQSTDGAVMLACNWNTCMLLEQWIRQ